MRKSVKFPIISSQFLIKWEFYPLRELRQKKLTKKGKLQRSNRSMVIEALNWVRGYSANYFPFVSHLENLKALQTLWRSWREQRAANWGRRGLEPSICDRKRSAGQERVWLPGFRNRNRALEHQRISHGNSIVGKRKAYAWSSTTRTIWFQLFLSCVSPQNIFSLIKISTQSLLAKSFYPIPQG